MNILTFDIEDWFHILDHPQVENPRTWDNFESRVVINTEKILNLLDARSQKATFFCLGWIAERYPELIKRIYCRGHEIGSHSYYHKLAFNQSPIEFEIDLLRSIAILEDITGQKVKAYRAPGYSFTQDIPWVFDILINAGIEYDCSIFPARRAHGGFRGLPSIPFILERAGGAIKAFPINTFRVGRRDVVFSGGGYFRIFNYLIIRHMMLRSPYVMTYFHPRDFDTEQPIVPGLDVVRLIKCYIGIKGAMAKFERLIDDFKFHSLMCLDNESKEMQFPCVRVEGYNF
jgi:polysaccharide deacetylase family protein (PEP-CTERM system associated)